MVYNFPRELIDIIIDELVDDKPALIACSAVCRQWLPRCRQHLFRCLYYQGNRDLQPYPGNFNKKFFDLCDSDPSIYRFVRHLNLEEVKGRYSRDTLPAFVASLRLLTSLETLTISDARFYRWDSDALSHFPAKYHHLKDLRLHYGIRFRSFTALLEVVGACPQLEHLTLHVVSWVEKTSDVVLSPHIAPQVPARLKSLELGSIGRGQKGWVIRWLMSAPTPPALEKLRLFAVDGREVPGVTLLLRELGSLLKHLELSFVGHSNVILANSFSDTADLRYNNRLTTLHILRITDGWYGAGPGDMSWVPRLLLQVQEPSLEVVALHCARLPEDLRRMEWDNLDAVLVSPTFRNLQRVEFIACQSALQEPQNYFAARLPHCHTHGVAVRWKYNAADSRSMFDRVPVAVAPDAWRPNRKGVHIFP